jgi:hypothetical protein
MPTRLAFLQTGALVALTGSTGTPPDTDLAYLRLLVGVELLTRDYGSRHRGDPLVAQMHADDGAHYRGLANLLAEAGVTAAIAGDVDFSYPRAKPDELGWTLKTLSLGAYLGAVANVQTPAYRLPLGQIAANEAQHVSAFAHLLGKPLIGQAFATALPIATVSDALDRYES